MGFSLSHYKPLLDSNLAIKYLKIKNLIQQEEAYKTN